MRPVSTCAMLWATVLLISPAVPTAPAPTEQLQGTILAADGTPAGGAIVWAAKFASGPLERREAVADAQGRYVLDLRPGEWYFWARRGSQGANGPPPHGKFKVVAGRAPEPLTIRLEERGTLRGRLLEAGTGKPIPGGQLFLDAGLVLTTDAAGRFEVGGLARKNHEAFVVAPGRMRMRVLFDTTTHADTELDVPVPVGGKLIGSVTDIDGKPLPGAYVGRHTSGSYFSINGLFAACDAAGRFEYDDAVPPDQPSRLSAAAPGYVEEERDGLAASSDKLLELHFRLRPIPAAVPDPKSPVDQKRRIVSGVVRGPDDKPLAGIVVRWGYEPYTSAIQTKTDAEGRVRLTVPDAAGVLAVLPRDYAPQFPRVVAGGDQTVEITLSEGHTARGLVTDADGKPIRDVQVIPVIPSPDSRIGNPFWLTESQVRTNGEGKFELKGVPDSARFDFLKSGLSELRSQRLQLDVADNGVTMIYGGAIAGRVMDAERKPIRSFRVLVGFPNDRRPDDRSGGYFAGYNGTGVRFTSVDGSFILTDINANSVHRITVLAEGHGGVAVDRVVALPLNVLAAREPVSFRLSPPAALRVRAVAADGKPIAGARVTLVNGERGLDRSFMWGYSNASWENMVRGRTATDGWAAFPALEFGEATVLVEAPGHARHRLAWRNGQAELPVELAREAILVADVRDASGAPVKACYVNLSSGGDRIAARVSPDDHGRFRVAELPAGEWTVMVRGKDGRSQLYSGRVTLKAGETKELTIDAQEKE
jgi:hypothetical protein